MKRFLLAVAIVAAACEGSPTASGPMPMPQRDETPGFCTLLNGNVVAQGFDIYGYDRCARIFVGKADGVDKKLDGMVWGDPTWANDQLVMKWNEEWDRGNAEHWSNPPYAAWEDNQWNGMRRDGSGYTEHFKTQWSQECANGQTPSTGGTCIWGQFEVLMEHGTDPDYGHFWIVKAIPSGYGN